MCPFLAVPSGLETAFLSSHLACALSSLRTLFWSPRQHGSAWPLHPEEPFSPYSTSSSCDWSSSLCSFAPECCGAQASSVCLVHWKIPRALAVSGTVVCMCSVTSVMSNCLRPSSLLYKIKFLKSGVCFSPPWVSKDIVFILIFLLLCVGDMEC